MAAYYYLRILVVMYFHEPGEAATSAPRPGAAIQVVLWTAAVATIVLGVFPDLILKFAGTAAVLTAGR